MKSYIITVIGATLLGAMADILAPEKWRKYISVITGFVIISCMIAPIGALVHTDIIKGFDSAGLEKTDYENAALEAVLEETQKRIAADIDKRALEEFNIKAKSEVSLSLNGDNKIDGVNKIIIHAKRSLPLTRRLCEVYGVEESEVLYDE
ncbi:MAG: stage III sporulation protein AF [Clostridiales bacterium]|nr:stage III sporulation protein AF [Clostridiales bacterium]